MRTDFDAVASAPLDQVMADAREMQGIHGAGLIAAAVRRFRRAVVQAVSPELGGSAARLRLH